jgi:hypothetical protein
MGTIWGKRNKEEERKNERKGLTLTGLLMEGPTQSSALSAVRPGHVTNEMLAS